MKGYYTSMVDSTLMRFKVIVCSRCGRARGARTDSKKVTCSKCGTVIKVKEAKAYQTTDSEQELAAGVAEVNATLQLRKDGEKEDIPHPSSVRIGAGTKKARRKTVEHMIEELGKKRDTFSFEDILTLLSKEQGIARSDIDEGEILRLIDGLKTKGVLIEPRDGTYRPV